MLKIVLITLAMMGLQQAQANQVQFKLEKNPILVNSDLIMNPGKLNEYQVTGPWFSVDLQVTNLDGAPVRVESLNLLCAGNKNFYQMGFYSNGKILNPGESEKIQNFAGNIPLGEPSQIACTLVVNWWSGEMAKQNSFGLNPL